MQKYIANYDGFFYCKGRKILYSVTDNSNSKIIIKNNEEHYGRYLNFFEENGDVITSGVAIYGSASEMENILPEYAKTKFKHC